MQTYIASPCNSLHSGAVLSRGEQRIWWMASWTVAWSPQTRQFQKMGGAIDKDPSVCSAILNCSAVSMLCLCESTSLLLVGQNEWPMNLYMVQSDGGCYPDKSWSETPHFRQYLGTNSVLICYNLLLELLPPLSQLFQSCHLFCLATWLLEVACLFIIASMQMDNEGKVRWGNLECGVTWKLERDCCLGTTR